MRIKIVKVIEIDDKKLELEFLILDFNGTIACGGEVIQEVIPLLELLSKSLKISIITADTFETVKVQTNNLPVRLVNLFSQHHTEEKALFIDDLGRDRCIAIGNGNNDAKMLEIAKIGIAVMGCEGGSREAISSADIVCKDIIDALNLIIYPSRLKATLRR